MGIVNRLGLEKSVILLAAVVSFCTAFLANISVALPLIARELSMSPDYVSHTFKNQYGYSPMQYVNILRVGQAQTRLIDTKDKIADIATDVGFNNIGNFNRAFYLLVGLSPREFRKANVSR